MKKITLFIALVAISFMASATIYMDETLNYADGTLKPNWTANGTIGTWSSDFMVGGTALNYSNSGGTPYLANIGKKISCDYQSPYGATNYYNYKSFNTTSISSGNVYVSFLYTPNGSLNTQSNAPLLLLTGTNSTTGVSVYVGKALSPNDGTNFRFGTTRGSSTSTDIKWSTTEFSMEDYKSSVFFIVLKYDLSSQVSYLYINPIVGTSSEPTANASDATSTSSTKTSVQVVEVKANGSTKTVYNISSIRVASTWAEAVAAKSAAPQLPAPTIGSASNVAAESFTANWTAVPNAVGYAINVYEGVNLQGTYNVDGETTEIHTIKGLWVNTTYTYKVIAKGDGTINSDSDESTASTEFTTLGGLTTISTDFSDADAWGVPEPTDLGLENYPSSEVNGYILNAAYLRTGTIESLRGDLLENRIAVDKSTFGGRITLPIVNSLRQIEIDATSGSDARGFKIEKSLNGTTWDLVDTYTTNKAIGNFIIPLSSDVPVKLRISNNTTSALYVWKIITRTSNPALLPSPVVGEASGILATRFTANWTPIANASGYKVRVYQGTNLVATVEAAGQAASSVEVTGLEMDTEYTYKVFAIGDGFVNYADSYLSTASMQFTTGNTTSVSSVNQDIKIFTSNNQLYSNVPGVVELFGVQGNLILKSEIKNVLPVVLSNGMYLVRHTANDGTIYSTKISVR